MGANKQWVVVETHQCEYIPITAEMWEERIYPADRVWGVSDFRIGARACSEAVQCNIAGVPCKHAFLNPDNDPFEK